MTEELPARPPTRQELLAELDDAMDAVERLDPTAATLFSVVQSCFVPGLRLASRGHTPSNLNVVYKANPATAPPSIQAPNNGPSSRTSNLAPQPSRAPRQLNMRTKSSGVFDVSDHNLIKLALHPTPDPAQESMSLVDKSWEYPFLPLLSPSSSTSNSSFRSFAALENASLALSASAPKRDSSGPDRPQDAERDTPISTLTQAPRRLAAPVHTIARNTKERMAQTDHERARKRKRNREQTEKHEPKGRPKPTISPTQPGSGPKPVRRERISTHLHSTDSQSMKRRFQGTSRHFEERSRRLEEWSRRLSRSSVWREASSHQYSRPGPTRPNIDSFTR